MKTRHAITASALLVVLAACGNPSVTSTPDTDAAEAAISKPSTPAAKTKVAGIGDAITMKGLESTLKVAVKLNKVINNGVSATEFIEAGEGKRFYAVELVLKNVGTKPYDDSPSNGAAVIDADGQQFTPTIVDLKSGSALNSVTIAPGDVRRGLVAFEIPAKAKIVKFQLALNSGFADQTGEWRTK